MNQDITINRQRNFDLWRTAFMTVSLGLIGTISKSMRGVALNFDGEIVQITAIFDTTPTEEEIENLQDIEAELISTHNYMSDLELLTIPISQNISHISRNLGWVFLRKK